MKPKILIVDDHQPTRELTNKALSAMGYEVEEAEDGYGAVAKAKFGIDLIILDLDMPGMNGFEVVHAIRSKPELAEIPVCMVTGNDIQNIETQARNTGVNDFLAKPFHIADLQNKISMLLNQQNVEKDFEHVQSSLDEAVEQTTQELKESLNQAAEAQRKAYQAQLETIYRLAVAAETKDNETGMHVKRVSSCCEYLAKIMLLSPKEVDTVRIASPLHDVGKIGIPDRILLKPGRLDEEEMAVMKTHTDIGARILDGSSSDLLEAGRLISMTHHEKWDGSGYPNQIAGEEIPVFGRICTVVDVFDALSSRRPYKDPFPREKIVQIMQEGRGSHFDPSIVDLFLEHYGEFEVIRNNYKD